MSSLLEACPAIQNKTTENTPVSFVEPVWTRRAHENTPRFGHTNDLNHLITGSKEDASGYVKGLLAGSILIAVFFLAWLVLLIVMKCMGPKRVGLFSGHVVSATKSGRTTLNKSNHDNGEGREEGIEATSFDPKNDEQALDTHATNDMFDGAEHGQEESLNESTMAVSVVGQSDSGANENSAAVTSMRGRAPESQNFFSARLLVEDAEKVAAASARSGSPEPQNFFSARLLVEDDIPVTKELGNDSADGLSDENFQGLDIDSLKRISNHQEARRAIRLRRVRIAAMVAGIFMFVFVILFMSVGVDNLLRAMGGTRDGLKEAIRLSEGAVRLIDDFEEAQTEALESTKTFSAEVKGFCPAICADVTGSDCNLELVPYGDLIGPILSFSQDALVNALNLPGIRNDLTELASDFASLEEATRSYEWAFYVALGFAAVVGVLDLLMIRSLYIAWRGVPNENLAGKIARCLRSSFLLPAFGGAVFMTFLFTEVFVIGSTVSNDFCVDSPDPKVSGILLEIQEKFSSIIFLFAFYYTAGCPPGTFPQGFQEGIDQLGALLLTVNEFSGDIADNPTELQATCGTNDTTVISAAAFALESQTCVWASLLVDMQDFMSCNNWHPLYSTLVYSAVCYEASEGLYWIALASFCMVFFAMVMLTLRAGFYEIETENEVKSYRDKWRRYLECCSSCTGTRNK